MRHIPIVMIVTALASCAAPSPSHPPTPVPLSPGVTGVRITDGSTDLRISTSGSALCGPMSRAEISAAVNAFSAARASAGLGRAISDPHAQRAAEAHACDMARRGTMTHRGDLSPMGRLKASGFRSPALVSENVAAGKLTDAAVISAWSGSPKHLYNIVIPGADKVGFARARDSAGNGYWVSVHAARR